MNDFNEIKKVYFLGIGGIGVSAVARMFLLEGKVVLGSDTAESEITKELELAGAKIFIGQEIENVPEDTDLVIYTIAIEKYAKEFMRQVRQKIVKNFNPENDNLFLCPCCGSRVMSTLGHYEICKVCTWEDDPVQLCDPNYDGGANRISLEDARKKWLDTVTEKVISYPEALSIISRNKFTIAIAGTHGKTTTTAMIAKIMIDAGLDPTVIVGSILNDYKTNFIAGKSKYFVVEACEYCRSFLNIHPTVAVVTTIDADHLDYYKDLNDIEGAFKEFISQSKEMVVADKATENRIRGEENQKFIDPDKFYDSELKLKIPGEHNRKNAACALGVAHYLGIDLEMAKESLRTFSSTWRRFEYKGKMKTGATVYDDYAHHPTEIEATLKGAREMFPGKKITIAFQPHLFSRTKLLLEDFATTLSKADYVMILPIYKAREEEDSSISSEILTMKIKEKNEYALFFQDFDLIKSALLLCSSEDDVVLVMGAGDVSKLAEMLI